LAAVPQLGRATQVEPAPAPEAAATQDLYERYAGQIFGFCLNRLGSREEAEDATQTTFLNAFRGLRRGVDPEVESAWLFKIAHNVCLTRRRSSWRRGRVESPGDMQALQDFVAAPQRMGTDELIELQEALAAMPANQRKAILLREWQGLSYREIAEEMELSPSAVETLIFRARRSLARGLEQAPAERRSWAGRLRHGLDIGSAIVAIKAVFAGAASVQAVATATAATAAAVVVVASPPDAPVRHDLQTPVSTSAAAVRGTVTPPAVRGDGPVAAPRRSATAARPSPVAPSRPVAAFGGFDLEAAYSGLRSPVAPSGAPLPALEAEPASPGEGPPASGSPTPAQEQAPPASARPARPAPAKAPKVPSASRPPGQSAGTPPQAGSPAAGLRPAARGAPSPPAAGELPPGRPSAAGPPPARADKLEPGPPAHAAGPQPGQPAPAAKPEPGPPANAAGPQPGPPAYVGKPEPPKGAAAEGGPPEGKGSAGK
jgi:RNA polymerase sigma factor (sigma-70 family)